MIGRGRFVTGAAAIFVACILGPAGALASSYLQVTALSCENGRRYPIRVATTSDLGDLVTGYVVTGKGRGIHFRLVPMGDGYRYAGQNFWFDGLSGEAVLYFGTPAEVACQVVED